MFCQLALTSLSLLIQSQTPAVPVQAAVAPPASAARGGSAGMFALGFVQLQPTAPGVAQVGHANITGVSRAGSFVGNGALLTALDAGSIANGTLNDLRLSSNIAKLATAQVFSGQKTFSSAPIFSAAGTPFSVSGNSVVTNLNCDLLDGLNSSAFLQSIPVPLALTNATNNGFAIKGTADNGSSAVGVWGLSAAGTGIRGDSQTGKGVAGFSSGGAAVDARTNTGIGVLAYNQQGGNAIEAYGIHGNGIVGFSAENGSSGVLGDNYASGVGGPGVTGRSSTNVGVLGIGAVNGVQGSTTNAGGSGVYGETSYAGFGVAGRCYGVGGVGVYGDGQGIGYGVVSGGDALMQNDLYVSGAKIGYVADLVRNVGSEPLEIGTLVEIVGASSPLLGQIPVIDVRKATSQHGRAALGPIAFALKVEASTFVAPVAADGTTPQVRDPQGFNLHRQEGAIAPGAFGSVVTLGSFAAIAVDASFGAVMPGDLLVASPNPGYAMVSSDPLPGTLIGKALGGLDFGTGQVAVIVKGD